MRLVSIEIENILSIEKASLNFNNNGLLLVEGWNHDTGRANGAGKTAIFDATCFALFDKVPRKITATEILRRGSKSGFACAVVVCGQDTWTVRRSRPKGVEFFRNGTAANITQKEFESHLRITYEQFVLTMYTAQSAAGGTDRFLLKSDTDKKKFLLRLLDLEKFSTAKKLADIKITSITKDINSLISKIQNDKSKIDVYRESIVDEESLTDSIKILQSSVESLSAECKTLSDVPRPNLSKYSKLEEDLNAKRSSIVESRAKRGMLHDRYRALEANVEQQESDICSECGSTLSTPESIEKHKRLHSKIVAELAATKLQIDDADKVISKEKEITIQWQKLKDKKAKESEDYQQASSRLIELKSLLRSKEMELKAVNLKFKENAEALAKIASLSEAVSLSEIELKAKQSDLTIYETVANIYSPTGAQAYILDSIVDMFNDTIGEFIDVVWPNASYQIHSQKENSDGEMVAKFSETLMMGKDEVSVGSLSGGEFKALSLCVDFTLLDILSKQFGIDLNPIILDEPFDGLDDVGKTIVINLLAKIAQQRQIIVIDHSSEAKSMFSDVIKVSKRNGVSSISLVS